MKHILINGVACDIDYQKLRLVSRYNPESWVEFERSASKLSWVDLHANITDKSIKLVTQNQIVTDKFSLPGDFISERYLNTAFLRQLMNEQRGLVLIELTNEHLDRLNGELPTVMLGSHEYRVDLPGWQLIPENADAAPISLHAFKPYEQGAKEPVYFDDYQQRLISIAELSAPPSAVVSVVTLPNLEELDPVGYALREGLPPTLLLDRGFEINMWRELSDSNAETLRDIRPKGTDEIILDGQLFQVDYNNRIFVRPDDPAIVAPFDSFLANGQTRRLHYSLFGDEPHFYTEIPDDHNRYLTVDVPERIFQGPFSHDQELVEKLNATAHQINSRLVDDAIIARLYHEQLPVVKLGDDLWQADAYRGVLIHSDPNVAPITEYDLDGNDFGDAYYVGYDTEKKELVYAQEDTCTYLPESYVVLEIPLFEILDPIGLAKRKHEGKPEMYTSLLIERPAKKFHVAKLRTQRELGIDKLLEENKKRLEQQKKKSKGHKR